MWMMVTRRLKVRNNDHKEDHLETEAVRKFEKKAMIMNIPQGATQASQRLQENSPHQKESPHVAAEALKS
jgi:hypothetical protein